MTYRNFIIDPMAFQKALWPDVVMYDKQWDVVYSAWNDRETVVPAANQLGKDFVAGFICLAFFISRNPCRIVTTSAGADHLDVLWGEINRWIDRSKIPLRKGDGGPLIVTHLNIDKVVGDRVCPISYIKGLVATDDNIAKMQGHHATPSDWASASDGIPRTMFVSDESSSVKDDYYKMAATWMKRALIFGNTWDCANFFKRAIKGDGDRDFGGDIPRENGIGFHRRVIKIKAVDSPNVKFGLWQESQGIEPDNRIIVPGVLPWEEYQFRRKYWDKVRQCVSLDADFYEGIENLLYPPERLNLAEMVARKLIGKVRKAEAIGCDPAEGGDSTVWCVTDRYGVIKMVSKKTPNTAVIVNETIRLMREYGVPAHKVYFDRGGGGQQHADQLRERGYPVQTVGFGETVSREIHRGMTQFNEKKEGKEERYAYKNRRAEMAGMVMEILDPDMYPLGFGIPAEYVELRRQMSPIPKLYDGEGRLYLPPKGKVEGSHIVCLRDLLGRSPDDFDSLCLAVYGMKNKRHQVTAGAI